VLGLFVYAVYVAQTGGFSGWAGVIVLALLMIPSLVQEYGHFLPDIPATACSAAAFTVLFVSFGRPGSKIDFSDKRSRWLFFLAGLLFGWSYLIKEYLAVLFLLIPLVFVMLKIPWRCLIPLALGMLLMYGVEALFGLIYYQDPFIRFIAAAPRETEGEIQKDIGRIISYFFSILIKSGGTGFLLIMGTGFLYSIIKSLKKVKPFTFLLGWILLIYLLFTFAGLLPVVFNWQNIVLMRLHKFRYWVPILPPLVIGGVAALDALFQKLAMKLHFKKQTPVNLLLAIFIFTAGALGFESIKDDPNFVRNNADHYLELRQYLINEKSTCQELIWVDRDNRRAFNRILPMYIRRPFGKLIWHGQLKYINTKGLYLQADEINPGCIIIDRYFMAPGTPGIPAYLSNPPENWSLVFESQNQEIALYDIN
jgi:hypothetical protein